MNTFLNQYKIETLEKVVLMLFKHLSPNGQFSPNGFLFFAVSIFLVVVTVCKSQRFISVYCQSVFLSGACATTGVGRTFRREFTLVREVRTTAVSRRLRKTDWCFYSVFVKPHPAAVFVKAHPVADLYLSTS